MKCRRNDLARPFGRHLLPGNHQDASGGIDLRTGAIALKLMVLVIDVDDFLSRLLSRRPCGIGSKSNREMVGLDVDPGDIG